MATENPEPRTSEGPAPRVVVIGAGPAGLTAAYQLTKAGIPSTILEATDVVGGISQTAERDGWRFDIGGHRFFTKVQPVENLWHEILDDDEFLQRPRMSRIYYQGKYYDYPIKPLNALRNLGFVEAESGRLPEASTHLAEALRLDPKDVLALTLLGKIRLQQGDRAAARELFRRALALDPRNPDALQGMSSLSR